MNDLEPIKRKIYEIRGYKVMLDSDLAELYNVETKNLKRAVRANIERFPDDFMFELTKEEYDSLRCKNFTLKSEENENALRCKNFTSNNRSKIMQLRVDLNDILADQNDINETTRAQLDAISSALAELQSDRARHTGCNPIGFNVPKQ